MNVFLDTSSLLKLYHNEPGSDALIATLSQGIESIYLSELAILEFRSAIWKKTRTGEIDTDTANTVIACFQQDYAKFQWISIDNEVIQQAQNLLMKHGSAGLRTLDAIQLACALTLKEEPEACFFTADTLLKSFFKQEGLT
jgi:predicted nucleic acid-binding protein